ncbi:MAG TPA: MFS transporter [Alphaproteobacteria bacterium]|nr:MFS transporter [Alphaproteobacteria bacterium]
MAANGTGARLKEWAAILIMLSSAPSLSLIFTVTPPVMPMMAAHFGPGGRPAIVIPWLGLEIDSVLFAQLITGMPSAGLILGGPLTGLLIDRLGVRRVMIGGAAVYAFLGSAGLYIDNAALLLASRFVLGFAAIAFAASTIALIGARFTDAARARMVSYRQFVGSVGGIAATLIAGQIGEFGWHAPFALFLVVFLLVPIALWAVPAMPPLARADRGAAESLRFLWPTFALVAGLAVVMMMNATQVPFLLRDIGISTPASISRVTVMGSVTSMLGSLTYSLLGPKLGTRANYSLIAAALGVGVMAVGLSHDALSARIGVGLAGLGAGYLNPHFGRFVLDRAPPAARGRAVGLYFSAIYLGDLMNPFVVRPIANLIGIHQAFLAFGAIIAVTALQIVVPGRPAPMKERKA